MSDHDPTAWRPLCAAADVEVGMPRRVDGAGMPPLAVFRLDDGYFVLDDTCSHGRASLSEGYVEGDDIECPWHGGRFCIRDGRPTAAPAAAPVRSYPARVIDGQVCIAADEAGAVEAGAVGP